MRVLAVGAHPDDIDLQCAGTLAKYAARGDQVCIAISTNGEAGSVDAPMEVTARTREQEARASAAVIGAELIWLNYHDEFLYENEQVRLRYIELVRQTRPDVIITHDPHSDYHPDHLTTGLLLWNTRVMAAAGTIKTEHPAWPKIPTFTSWIIWLALISSRTIMSILLQPWMSSERCFHSIAAKSNS